MADTESLSDRILRRLRDKPVVAFVIVVGTVVIGVGAFSDALARIYALGSAILGGPTVSVVLPTETGWVFAGYYDETRGAYVQDPYLEVLRSHGSSKSQIPQIGDWIRIRNERNVVILRFREQGLTNIFEPPWRGNILTPSDYTGIKLPKGTVMEVRDVSLGAFPGKPESVWIRVGAIPK